MKKTLALVLALLFSAGSIVACGGGETETKTPTNTPGTSDSSTETNQEETASTTPNWDAVDKTTLGGISISTAAMEHQPDGEYMALDFDDYTSDVLDDAIFDRNRLLESTLDCKFEVTNYFKNQGLADAVKQSIDAGDGSVDISFTSMYEIGNLLTDSRLVPFNYINTIDLSQPWWDQQLLKDSRIVGMDFYGYLDFSFHHYDSMQVIYYNGNLLEKYPDMEDPYDLYKNQQWTIEKMLEMAEKAAEDLNGDGEQKIGDDQYGVVGPTCERMPMIFASGLHSIEWDEEEQVYKLMMGEERFINTLEMIVKLRGKAANKVFSNTSTQSGTEAFKQGRALFLTTSLGTFKTLRSVEDDYALIPHPTYDYAVSEHYNFVPGPVAFCLPIDIGDDNGDGKDDYSEIGIFLQAAGAYTYDAIVDVYVEKSVIGKGLRDQKSVEMFYEMIQNRSACLTFAYQTYGMSSVTNLATDYEEGFAGQIAAFTKKFNAYATRLSGLVLAQAEKVKSSFEITE